MPTPYAVVRYYKTKKTKTVLHENVAGIERARELAAEYPTKRVRKNEFNSFVGFTKMANL